MNSSLGLRVSLLIIAISLIATCHCDGGHFDVADGTITITTPSLRIKIDTLKPQWGEIINEMKQSPLYQDAEAKNIDSGVQSGDDDIAIKEDAVVFREAKTGPKKTDVRIRTMSPSIQKWIAVKVQEMSFMLTDLRNEMHIRDRKPGVVLANHILFLNTYVDLYHIARANLPNIRWLQEKLFVYDDYVSDSLKYVNRWVEWAQENLTHIENKDPKNFKSNKTWLNLVWALKRLKKEQTVSKDTNTMIQEALNKSINYNSRSDWLKSSLIGNRQPDELIYYREGIDKVVPKSFPLGYQYSRFHYNF